MSRRFDPWLIWGLAASFYGYGFFQRVAPSVIVDELMVEFALSGAMLGALSAAYFYSYAALQIPIGVLLDRFGPRRLLIGGGMVASLGGLLFALAPDYLLAIAARALLGAGVAVGYIATLKLASSWFGLERFGMLAGLTLTAGTIGAMAAQLPLAALLTLMDWRIGLLLVAGFGVLLTLAMVVVVRDAPPGTPPPEKGGKGTLLAPLRILLARGDIWMLTVAAGLLGAPMLTFAGLWGVPYFVQVHGLPETGAGGLTSVMLLAWAMGGPMLGALSDRLGRRRPVLVGAALVNAALWCLLAGLGDAGLWIVMPCVAVIGFCSGGMVVAFAASRERAGKAAAGTALGIVNSAVLLFGAFLQTVFGALLDLTWTGAMVGGAPLYDLAGYRLGFLLFTATALVVAAAAVLLGPGERREADGVAET